MGLLEKVKKFFYDEEIDEEEDEQEVEETVEPEKKPARTYHKERSARLEKREEDISERELFKAERTFNFPMDIGVEDEEEETKSEESSKIDAEKFVPLRRYNEEVRDNAYAGIRNYAAYEPSVKPEPKEEKKFKPTPIISPIYGVIDANAKKDVSTEKKVETYNTIKKLDYDTVRKKAYSDVYEEEKDESKGIFFNLDEDSNNDEDFNNEDDVKIIYNDVTFEEEDNNIVNTEEENDNTDVANEVIEEDKVLEVEDDNEENSEEKILSESNEDDLFNLIDNMYNSQDDDEEE